MGVSTNVYTVYGVRHDWDEEFSEAYDDVYEDLEQFVILDGMSGEYIVIGEILFDSGDSRWEPMAGFSNIDISDLPQKRADVERAFAEKLPSHTRMLEGDWSLMTFVHYH